MANKRISQLAPAAALTGSELVIVSQISSTVTLTALDISALASDNSFNTAASNFITAGFAIGQSVKAAGFVNPANNIVAGVITAVTAAKLTIGGTDGDVIIDEAAGASVTIAAWESRRAAASELVTGGSALAVMDEGIELTPAAASLNFVGAGVTAANAAGAITVTIPGGGGSGGGTRTLAVHGPWDSQPPAANFATLDTRNSIAVLDFDDTTEEHVFFVGIVPEGANLASGLLVRIHWAATAATSGQVRWGARFERGGTGLDADSYDIAAEAHSVTKPTSGIETITEITITTIDGLAAGDRYRLDVYRDSTDSVNDTMAGDAELVAVEVRSAA